MTEQDETRPSMDSTSTPPQPPHATPVTRRLTRRSQNRVVGGVASGIADYFGIDPVVIRIVFIVLTVVGGSGVVLYLIGWLLMPADDGRPSTGERLLSRSGSLRLWIGAGLIIFATLHFLGHTFAGDANLFEPDFLWGVGLAALGVYLLMREEPDPRSDAPAASATAPVAEGAPTGPAPSAAATVPMPAVPTVKRAGSPLGPLTMGAGLLALGAAALLDNIGVIEMSFSRYPALLLAVMGAGLVAGAWWGRSRGLIVLGVLLVPVVFTAGLIDVPFRGGVGDHYFRPLEAADVQDEYRLSMGHLVVDLTSLEPTSTTVVIDASVALGELEILVPRGASIDVRGDVGAGEVWALGSTEGGLDVSATESSFRDGEGLFVVNGSVGLGRVEVRRADAE